MHTGFVEKCAGISQEKMHQVLALMKSPSVRLGV